MFLIKRDFTIINGPIVNIQSASTTLTISTTNPYLFGSYYFILRNINITGLNTPLLDTSATEPLNVLIPCGANPIGNTGIGDLIYRSFDIPQDPGTNVQTFVGAAPCSSS